MWGEDSVRGCKGARGNMLPKSSPGMLSSPQQLPEDTHDKRVEGKG